MPPNITRSGQKLLYQIRGPFVKPSPQKNQLFFAAQCCIKEKKMPIELWSPSCYTFFICSSISIRLFHLPPKKQAVSGGQCEITFLSSTDIRGAPIPFTCNVCRSAQNIPTRQRPPPTADAAADKKEHRGHPDSISRSLPGPVPFGRLPVYPAQARKILWHEAVRTDRFGGSSMKTGKK